MPADKSDMSSFRREKGDRFCMNRRSFLKASAFTAAVAASRIIKYPEISPLVSSQASAEGIITERWITTPCLNCSTCCAT